MKAAWVSQSTAEHPGASQEAFFFFFPWNMTIMSEHLLSRAGKDNAFVERGSLVIQLLRGNAFLGVTGVLCVAGLGSLL